MKLSAGQQRYFSEACTSTVRVRAMAVDPNAGLKGCDYIKARQLNKPVERIVQTSAQSVQLNSSAVL